MIHRCSNGKLKPYGAAFCSICLGRGTDILADNLPVFETYTIPGFNSVPELITERIIYVAKCSANCDFLDINLHETTKRETQCPYCKKWIEYEKIRWIGQDKF